MKKISFLFLTVSMLLFSACSGKPGMEQPGETVEKDEYRVKESSIFSTRTFSDLGVLQSRLEGEHKGVCYFFDPVSEREVPLCVKTNCTHQGYSWGNSHPDCDACLGEITTCAAIIGDSLYYVSMDSEDGLFRKKICRADPDGTNRKVLEVMEDAEVFVYGTYENGYLIYTYYTQTAQDGTPLEKRLPGICLYNLENNEAQYIIGPESYSGTLSTATVQDNCLYYFYNYLAEDLSEISFEEAPDEKFFEYLETINRRELWAYDLDTKEQRLVKQESGVTGTVFVSCGYAYMEGKYGSRLLNLSTGESRELGLEWIQNKGKQATEEGILLYGEGSIELWEFDTGEVKHIVSYDEDLMISLEYIGENWVYGLDMDGNGPGKIFYLSKEQLMKGDLEWKYLPVEEQ